MMFVMPYLPPVDVILFNIWSTEIVDSLHPQCNSVGSGAYQEVFRSCGHHPHEWINAAV